MLREFKGDGSNRKLVFTRPGEERRLAQRLSATTTRNPACCSNRPAPEISQFIRPIKNASSNSPTDSACQRSFMCQTRRKTILTSVPLLYLGLKIANKSADVQRISIVAYSDLRPRFLATAPDVEVRYSYKNAAIIASNQSNEHWTRFFGTTAKNPICSYTTDISVVTDNFNITPSLRPSCEQYVGGSFSAERCSVQYVPLANNSA